MSRWISSVNKLLDNLDTNVNDVVENQVEMYDDLYAIQGGDITRVNGVESGIGSAGVGGESSVDDILARRGLYDDDEEEEREQDKGDRGNDDNDSANDVENEEEEEEDEIDEHSHDKDGYQDNVEDEVNEEHDIAEKDQDDHEIMFDVSATTTDSDAVNDNIHDINDNDNEQQQEIDQEAPKDKKNTTMSTATDESNIDKVMNNKVTVGQSQTTKSLLPQQNQQQQILEKEQITSLKNQLQQQKQINEQTKKEAAEAHKETRKLRRTVVKINAELDSAENELDAQRTELERAAVRMEKERQRYKEDKERMDKSHKEDLKAVMEEHKVSIDAMVTSHAAQMVDMEERIKRAEEARAKEGGDMSIELAEAADREREMVKKVISLEEERSTLKSQIASLNTQLNASQSRAESLQEAAEIASEQEREADDRLDAALSLHARQIAQRQAREAELERTVADIAAALVVARQREAQLANNGVTKESSDQFDDVNFLKEKLKSTEDEIELFKAQIMLERQKSETLQKELEEVSNERTQELSSNLARQKQYDRRVSDLSSEITQLQSKLRSLDHNGSIEKTIDGDEENKASHHFQAKENEYKKQISSLSEDLLRVRGRLENSSTEVQTLRNRLRAALNRAEIAEKEAKTASTIVIDHGAYDVERGPLMAHKRRFGSRSRKSASIRSILKLDSASNETQEAIGGMIDSLDIALTKALNYLRMDPFGRMFFILYLGFLHLWTFCLLAFHAHGTLEPPANVGPEQLLKYSHRQMEQLHGKP